MIEECLEWIQDIDVEIAQRGWLFGSESSVPVEDMITCICNINVSDDEEKALLDLI
jgi:hypothetical protein